MRRYLVFALGLAALAGCGDDPVDVAGDYTVAITNRADGCSIGWTEGQSASGIAVSMTQSGSAATAEVGGGAALALDLVVGEHIFTGTVAGNDLLLTAEGTVSRTQGTCDYTIDATIDGALDGDVLTGYLRYRAQTDQSTDCGNLIGCESTQEFNGTRPPT